PFLDAVYAVPFTSFPTVEGDPAAALAGVPRAWTYVVENERVRDPGHAAFAGFQAFFAASRAHLRPAHPPGVAAAEPPAYHPHQELRLELPADARRAARDTLGEGRRAIAVILAGSSAARHLYPSIASWELILHALAREHPGTVFP